MTAATHAAVVAAVIRHVYGPLTWKPVRWKDGAAHAGPKTARLALYDRKGKPVRTVFLDGLVGELADALPMKRSHAALVAVRQEALRILVSS